LQTVKKTE